MRQQHVIRMMLACLQASAEATECAMADGALDELAARIPGGDAEALIDDLLEFGAAYRAAPPTDDTAAARLFELPVTQRLYASTPRFARIRYQHH